VTSSGGDASDAAEGDFGVEPLMLQSLQSSLVSALETSSMSGTFVTRANSDSVSVSAIMGDGTAVTVLPLNATATATRSATASASPSVAAAGAASATRSRSDAKTTAWMATAVVVICVVAVAAVGVGFVVYRRRVAAAVGARKAAWGTAATASGGASTPVVRRASTRIRTDTAPATGVAVVENPIMQPPRGVASPHPPPPPGGSNDTAQVPDHMSRAAAASLAARSRGAGVGSGSGSGSSGGSGAAGTSAGVATLGPDAVVISVSPAPQTSDVATPGTQ
jgi:hypothetical protein